MDATRRPTLRQVAALAGVSHQTVSRYLRSDSTLRPTTLEKVRAAVEELGYRPNLLARSMRTRRSGVLGIVLPGWSGAERSLAAACDLAQREGYRVEVVIGVGQGPAGLALRARELLADGQVEGVLSLTPLGPLVDPEDRVLQLTEYDDRLRAVDAVADDAVTMHEILRRLAELGHRDVLHVAGPQDWNSARIRCEGFRSSCTELGLRSHGEPEGDWHPDHGIAAVRALPATTPVTAVVAGSDAIAVGVLHAARERGWEVPGRMSVIGWDDQELLRYLSPQLSTVHVDRESAGLHAMSRLIATVRGEPEPAPVGVSLTRVEFRGTTAPPPDLRLG